MEEEDLIAGLPQASPQEDEDENLLAGLPSASSPAPSSVAEDEDLLSGLPSAAPQEDTYEGFAQELFEGIISGATKIPQGIAETLALGYDAAAGTDYASDVTEAGEDFRDRLGVDPEGLAGTIPEVGVQFVGPGGAAAKAIGSISKAGKAVKFLQQVGAAGLVDVLVSTEDTTTLGDFFEGGPTQKADLVGMEGTERALAKAGNKLRVGLEGALGTVAAPVIARTASAGAGKAATAVGQIPGATQTARVVQKAGHKVAEQAARLERARIANENIGPVRAALADTFATLRPRGYLPQEVAEPRSLISSQSDAAIKEANRLAANVEKTINKALARTAEVTGSASPLTRAGVMNNLNDFLTNKNREVAGKSLDNLPQTLKPLAKQMRNDIDKITKSLLDSEFVAGNAADETIRKMQNNIGSYMRRRYRVFEDADYTPDDDTLRLAFDGFKKDPAATQNELLKLVDNGNYSPEDLGLTPDKRLLGPVTDQQAVLARDKFLDDHRLKNIKARSNKSDVPRTPDYKLRNDLFIDRVELRDYQKALMGEIKNPVENFVATVADLSEFKAADEYYRKISQMAETEPGVQMLFKNTAKLSDGEIKKLTEEQGYKILGGTKGDLATKKGQEAALKSGWGALYGYAVPDRVYKDLSRVVAGDTNIMGNAARSLYSTFLRTKGASQYGTTVLSPPTQIRNATTGGFFAAMQGNIGSGASLKDSMRMVYNNLKELPDEQLALEGDEAVRLGLFGSQAELREMRDLLGKGLGYTEETVVNGLPVGRKFGSKLTDNFVIGALAKGGKKAEKLYQGGDEFWKYYNFQFEQNKLRNALGDLPLEEQERWLLSKAPGSRASAGEVTQESVDRLMREEAARIVRNQVPNYNLVPEAVRAARKLPVGNFTAFPYEILRTSANTVTRGIEELADPNVEIQKIGLRRLMGSLATAGMFGTTMSALSNQLSDVSEEEIEAYKRSVAYPWERNARLIPVGRHEDGTPRFVNLSYSNPYDMIERMVVGAMNKYQDGQLEGKNAGQLVFEAGSEALYELFAPFTDESMVTASLRDVLDPESKVPGIRQLGQLAGGRAGQTIYGAEIYNPEADAGEKLARSFTHVADSILPNIVPISGSGGDIEPSRFARGFINSLGLNEALGVSEKDRLDRERELSAELARVFSGISETESQMERAVYYKAAEFQGARSDASRIFNSVTSRPNATREQLLDAYERANEARFRTFQRFNQVLRDAESLGLNKSKIRRIMRENKVSGVNEVIQGRYAPLDISDTALDNLRRNGLLRELPRREINQIRNAQRRRQYAPIPEPVYEETDSGAEPLPQATELQPAPVEEAPGGPLSSGGRFEVVPPAVAAPQPENRQSAPAPAPAPSPAPEERQAPPAELLGGNLFDRMRNAELLRQRGEE